MGRVSRRYPFGPTSGQRHATACGLLPADLTAVEAAARRPRRGGERVDQAVVDGLLRGQDLVALDVLADVVDVLAGVAGQDLLQQAAHPQDLVGLDLDVAGRPVGALGVGLVDEHPRVGDGEPLAGAPAADNTAAADALLAMQTVPDVGLDELHRVVDGRHRRERAARRVDVDLDVAVGVHGLQADELSHDGVGDVVGDRCRGR